jgi:predicted nucleic acid-binding protein
MHARLGMTLDQVDELLDKLRVVAEIIEEPPVVFEHPIDPKDGPYIDLAVAASATVITSRDKHLLNLMNPAKPWSADFRARFPQMRVISPEVFLQELRAGLDKAGDV